MNRHRLDLRGEHLHLIQALFTLRCPILVIILALWHLEDVCELFLRFRTDILSAPSERDRRTRVRSSILQGLWLVRIRIHAEAYVFRDIQRVKPYAMGFAELRVVARERSQFLLELYELSCNPGDVRCELFGLRGDDGVLRVKTKDAAWQREVERSASLIRSRLDSLLGERVVRYIEVKSV